MIMPLLSASLRAGFSKFEHAFRVLALVGSVLGAAVVGFAQINYDVPYTFTTIAGRASQGSADGKGSAARFNEPEGVLADGEGTIYVADTYNHVIRKITRDGVVTTFVGKAGVRGHLDGVGLEVELAEPTGMALDAKGNLYVADTATSVIRKVTPAGMVSTFAGRPRERGSRDGTARNATFQDPRGIACAPDGTLYVADSHNYTIRRIDVKGNVTTLAGKAEQSGHQDGTGSAARFSYPESILLDDTGNLWVRDNGILRKVTPKGKVTTPSLELPIVSAMCRDSAGNIYVADEKGEEIIKISPKGGQIPVVQGEMSAVPCTLWLTLDPQE
ncbi:MAG: hypothetical protein NVV63_12970 [Opitutus sp.]|nr:hypothetical protein [Opitutus sp.]